mgnify:CR=1 FL=1
MTAMTSYLINRVIPENSDPNEPGNRLKIGQFEGYLSIFCNVILFIVKFFLGFLSQSIALLADAFHTLMDVATSGIVILGFRMSLKPADAEHPFGHGRAETIASLTISFLIGLVGFEFLKTSIERIFNQQDIIVTTSIIFVLIITIFVKEIMAKISHEMGDIIESDALKGDAVHHHSDVLSSILVLIGLAGSKMNLLWLDSLMGIGVSGFILYTGFGLAKSAIDELLGKPPSKELINQIKSDAISIEGVIDVHDVIVHQYGNRKYISLHVEVGMDHKAEDLHHIAENVEKKVSLSTRADVVTHIDPVDISNCAINKIQNIIKPILDKYSLENIQDLRVTEGKSGNLKKITFEIPCSVEFDKEAEITNELTHVIKGKYPKSLPQMKFSRQVAEIEGES